MQRGITPVIAVILLLLVTIAITGFAFLFFSRIASTSGRQIENETQYFVQQSGVRFAIESVGDNTAYIRNLGTSDIVNPAVYVDGNLIESGYELRKVNIGSAYNAAQAESYCNTNFGQEWHLFVPRSQNDVVSAWNIANSGSDQNSEYLRIFAIYPKFQGAACVNTAMNSVACTTWRAQDDGLFWVGSKTIITEPNGDNCVTGSMYYDWAGPGNVNWYNDINCPGYTSTRILCQPDKIRQNNAVGVRILDTLSSGSHTLKVCAGLVCDSSSFST
jgi:flagellin-like protein